MCRLKSLLAHSVSAVRLVFSHWVCSTLSGAAQNDPCFTSQYRESDKTQTDLMLSNGSRGTVLSNTDHSVQCRLKSNAPTDCISQHFAPCSRDRVNTSASAA